MVPSVGKIIIFYETDNNVLPSMEQYQVKFSQKWRTPNVNMLGPILFLNYEIADSTVSCFADDTRILLGIKDEENTQMIQNDLNRLYKWADTKFVSAHLHSLCKSFCILKRTGNKFAKTYRS